MGSNPILASFFVFIVKKFLFISTSCFFVVVAQFFGAVFAGEAIVKEGWFDGKVLKIATEAGFPPFEFVENGKIIGIDMDIIVEIAKRAGFKYEIENIPFGSIIAGIQTKKYDFAIAGIGITEERRKSVDFSDIYFNADFALISKNTKSFSSLKELKGKKVAVQLATTMQNFLVEYNSHLQDSEKIELLTFEGSQMGLETLMADKAEALFTEEMQGKIFSKLHSNLVVQKIKSNHGGYAIALQKNSPYTKDINKAIKELKHNGTIDKIIKKWEDKYISQVVKSEKKTQYRSALFSIFKCAIYTIQYSFASIFCGMFLALLLTLMNYSGIKVLHFLARAYISIIRGTPLLLQLSIIYFGLPHLLNINLSVFASGVIALSFNSSAYVAEIIRSGVKSLDKGQFEACKSLNLSKFQAIKDIYAPQVLRNILPSLINEFIALIKESSMISVIGGFEIMKMTNIVIAQYYSYFVPLLVAGATYYVMTATLEVFAHFVEKRFRF